MNKYFTILFFTFLYTSSISQTLQIVPRAGFQYHGISYISKGDLKPSDFNKSVPKFVVTIGADVKYRSKHFTHVLSIQSIALGPAFSFENMYLDKRIVPSFSGHSMASSIDHALLSYGIEKESRGYHFIKFNYSIQAGIGTNKSKEAYDTILPPDFYGMEDGTNYKQYSINYNRSGVGVFLTGKVGITYNNLRNKSILSLQFFWHQGLIKMAEYDISYQYGYYNYPQYRRDQQVKLKTRGTVFGCTLGVPIRLIK